MSQVGLFGKIPARGDFVRAGLPRDFIAPWDEWLQKILPASRAALGEAWLAAWMEAPVWRFRLSPGICGPHAALGLFMPSVDRAGRHFPLTLARLAPALASLAGIGEAWLDAVEAAGIAALEHDLDPDGLMSLLLAAEPEPADGPAARPANGAARGVADEAASWWTNGAPRVPPVAFATDTLPSASRFAWMLNASAALDASAALEAGAVGPDNAARRR